MTPHPDHSKPNPTKSRSLNNRTLAIATRSYAAMMAARCDIRFDTGIA